MRNMNVVKVWDGVKQPWRILVKNGVVLAWRPNHCGIWSDYQFFPQAVMELFDDEGEPYYVPDTMHASVLKFVCQRDTADRHEPDRKWMSPPNDKPSKTEAPRDLEGNTRTRSMGGGQGS